MLGVQPERLPLPHSGGRDDEMAHKRPLTQRTLDIWADNLREDGYPYIGSREHNYWRLLPDGRIRSEWKGEPLSEATVSTEEEIAESVYCWAHDC